jgi:hypothetical protein
MGTINSVLPSRLTVEGANLMQAIIKLSCFSKKIWLQAVSSRLLISNQSKGCESLVKMEKFMEMLFLIRLFEGKFCENLK